VSAAGMIAGCRDGVRRCGRAGAIGGAVLALSIVCLGAIAEKRADLIGAANRALEGSAFGLVIPLLVFAATATIIGPVRLDHAASPIARFGYSRRQVAAGLTLAAMALGGFSAAALGALSAVVAHDPSAPPAMADALTAAWIGALAGCAYAALFALGSTFGRRGGGRWIAVGIDFVLGASGTAAAVLLPRAHALNLLGGDPPLHVGQPVSAIVLVVMATVFGSLAIVRCPP
jgi:hypothetical protein